MIYCPKCLHNFDNSVWRHRSHKCPVCDVPFLMGDFPTAPEVRDPCQACGQTRDGMFLCAHCEWRMADELQQIALREAGRQPTLKQYLMWKDIWKGIPPWTDEDLVWPEGD
jgi:hypothetical protein